MDRVQQVNNFFKPSKGKMEKLGQSVSLIAGFIRNKLQLHKHIEPVCNHVDDIINIETINLNNNVQTNVYNVTESRRQRQELEHIFSQRSSLRNSTSNNDDETTEVQQPVSTSLINIQPKQNINQLPEASSMDSEEQNVVVQQIIQQQQHEMQQEWTNAQQQVQQEQQLQVQWFLQDVTITKLLDTSLSGFAVQGGGIFAPGKKQKYKYDPP